MFLLQFFDNPSFFVMWVVLIVFSICVHEATHAWVAAVEGDDTAVANGYLTLNPLKVMGPMSLLFVLLFGFAWGMVPVDPRRFRRPSSRAWVAAAGPLANLVLALLFAGLLLGLGQVDRSGDWATGTGGMSMLVVATGLQVNLFLVLFNLLPIPILDGWEVFKLLLPPLRRIGEAQARQFGFFALLLILFARLHYHLWDVAQATTTAVLAWGAGG